MQPPWSDAAKANSFQDFHCETDEAFVVVVLKSDVKAIVAECGHPLPVFIIRWPAVVHVWGYERGFVGKLFNSNAKKLAANEDQ